MEGAVLGTQGGSRFRTHAASALWTKTLPKQRRRSETVSVASPVRHHTYPRITPPKRAPISCRLEQVTCELPHQQHQVKAAELPELQTIRHEMDDVDMSTKQNGAVKLKRTLAREVASAWRSRVGCPDQPAPADRIQSLFNDIELYPTKAQVFEMLVYARKCIHRRDLTLTFGEFCVFAAELRRCSQQARQTPTKQESPQWTTDKEVVICKHHNGSEACPPPCEVFLGGSCNPTTWRSDIAIPMLKKMGITYFNPQVDDWSTELVEVEHRAKAAARALLFVLDSETRAVAACVEAAHLAAAPRDLLLVLRPYSRHQMIGKEAMSDLEYVELSRARATLQEAVERRGLPAFTDIPAALRCARAVLRGARTLPRQSLGHRILRLKRAFDAAGGRNTGLSRSKAVDTIRDFTKAPRDLADRCLPTSSDTVDFETFCAAVAELAADPGLEAVKEAAGSGMAGRLRRAFRSLRERLSSLTSESDCPRNGTDTPAGGADAGAAGGREGTERVTDTTREVNGMHSYNERLRACGKKLGLFIPKNGGSRTDSDTTASDTSGSVFTPGTERRLEQLPAMLGAPTHDVYLGGCFPTGRLKPEEFLRREGFTYIVPRVNDYTRMFSAPARRSAPAHPESPRTDKKPRPSLDLTNEDVQLRERPVSVEPSDRLSASDFYTVREDVTPQPFKGTYDEDLLLGSRVLVFAMSAEAPNFAAMVLAAHYMGLRPNVTVLVVQPMDPSLAQPYSESAVKDYNRGRHYLTDLARRTGVPVFDNTDDAMTCVVSRLRALQLPNTST